MTDIQKVLLDLEELGQTFAVACPYPADGVGGIDGLAGSRSTRFSAADLASPESGEAKRMAELHAQSRRMPPARHASSLAFQRYSHRLCGVGVAAWFRHGIVLDLTAPNVTMRFVDGSPDIVELHRPTIMRGVTAEDLVRTVLDRHLLSVAKGVSEAYGPRLPNLLGNIAAGFAGAFRTLSRSHPAAEVASAAAQVTAADSRLVRGGTFRILVGPLGDRLHYDRASCCHWYAAPDGKFCSWCSRLTTDERTARFRETMAAEAALCEQSAQHGQVG